MLKVEIFYLSLTSNNQYLKQYVIIIVPVNTYADY